MDYKLKEIYYEHPAKMNFLKGIISVMKADHIIEDCEQDVFQYLYNALELDDESVTVLESMIEEDHYEFTISFETKIQKLIFIKEAIQLCYADGHFHELEKACVKKFSDQLEVENEKFEGLINWIELGIQWFNQGVEIFDLDEKIDFAE